jgi:hypothetical protein
MSNDIKLAQIENYLMKKQQGLEDIILGTFEGIRAKLHDALGPTCPVADEPKLTTIYIDREPALGAFDLLWDGLTLTVPLYFDGPFVNLKRSRTSGVSNWPVPINERIRIVECFDLAPSAKPITGRSIIATVRHMLPLHERVSMAGDRWNLTINGDFERVATDARPIPLR